MDVETRVACNSMISILLFCVLVAYGLDMRVPYPQYVIDAFDKPVVRILSYISLYLMAYYNPIISILMFMCLMFLHIDYINLIGS